MYEKIQETASWLKERMTTSPETAIILGTGLGQLATEITDSYEFSYKDIPNFPVSTVEGHAGKLIFGKLGGKDIMAMEGRFHYYEGYSMKEVTFPIRVMYELGIKTLFVSNASGGMNPDFKIGDLMIITDHINFFPEHPLRGKNFPTGPRFPDMSHIYDPALNALVREAAAKHQILLREGTYVQLTGPQYESPNEIRALGILGADAVGMSTAVEAIAANHMGMHVCGISCITNKAAGLAKKPLSHQEVKETADRRAASFTALVTDTLAAMTAEKRQNA